jgi:hypothetical protein
MQLVRPYTSSAAEGKMSSDGATSDQFRQRRVGARTNQGAVADVASACATGLGHVLATPEDPEPQAVM